MTSEVKDQQVVLNLYLSNKLYAQFSRLRTAGLSASAIARLAIGKYPSASNLQDDDSPSCPVRVNLYLKPSDSDLLSAIASHNCCSKAQALRSIISTYLDMHSDAIDSLF